MLVVDECLPQRCQVFLVNRGIHIEQVCQHLVQPDQELRKNVGGGTVNEETTPHQPQNATRNFKTLLRQYNLVELQFDAHTLPLAHSFIGCGASMVIQSAIVANCLVSKMVFTMCGFFFSRTQSMLS